MSTRCLVKIVEQDKEIQLYHHHDGYISGVGYDLIKRFLNEETLKLEIPNDIYIVANKLIKDLEDEYNVTVYKHSDIEYLYVVDCDNNTITGYDVNNWGEEMVTNEVYSCSSILNSYLKENNLIQDINVGQIKLIHTLYKKLGWTDTKYKKLLNLMFDVSSCKSLNNIQANILINTLQSL